MNIISITAQNMVNETLEAVDNFIDAANEKAGELLEDDTKLQWEALRKKAHEFKLKYQNLNNQYNINDKWYKNFLIAGGNAKSKEAQSYRNKMKDILQQIYNSAFNLDNEVDKFYKNNLQKRLLYVYTNKNGKNPIIYDLSFDQMTSIIDHRGRIHGARALLENQIKEKGGFKKEVDAKNKAKIAYEGTLRRLSVFDQKVKQSGATSAIKILLWKENRKWIVARILNKGDLKEAYAAAVMNEHEQALSLINDVGNFPYQSHSLIKTFFYNYISKVDNKSAILGEDVITSQGQYAVKSLNAELPSINQYLLAAETIINSKNPLTKEQYEEELISKLPKVSQRNIVLKKLEDDLIENLNKTDLKKLLDAVKNKIRVQI